MTVPALRLASDAAPANMTRELTVIAVHGEADRANVNKLQKHRNAVAARGIMMQGGEVPPALMAEPDEMPNVTVVLRDSENHNRIELHTTDWAEVEAIKRLVGWDETRRQFIRGGTVKVTFG